MDTLKGLLQSCWKYCKLLWVWPASILGDKKKPNNIAVLDGVRATACLIVLTFHISLITESTHIWNPVNNSYLLLSSILLSGASGVTLFFVLSGFLLFLPYANALMYKNKWPSTRRFYLCRMFRIIPAYYAAVILMVLLFHHEYLRPQRWQELVLFFTFFMDSSPATYQYLNGPFWTLAVEWQFYLLLPLLALGISLFVRGSSPQRRAWILISCLLVVMAWGVFSRYWGRYFAVYPTQSFLIPRSWLNVILFFLYGMNGKFLEDFAIGMLISCCFVISRSASIESRLSRILLHLSPWLFGAGIVFLIFMAMWHFDQSYNHSWPFLDGLLPYYDWLSEICFASGYGLCVLAILFGPTRLKHPFEWPLLSWIGLISFSLYMWHLPLLVVFMNDVGSHKASWNPALVIILYCLWTIALVIPSSFLSYVLFEKPGVKIGEKLLRGREKSNPQVEKASKPASGQYDQDEKDSVPSAISRW